MAKPPVKTNLNTASSKPSNTTKVSYAVGSLITCTPNGAQPNFTATLKYALSILESSSQHE